MKGTVLRIATGVGVVAVLLTALAAPAAAAVPPTLAPVVSVANPHPGDYLRRGGDWIFGVACDPNASATDTSAGIAKVSVFLGDRDTTMGVPWFRTGGYSGSTTTVATASDLPFTAKSSAGRIGLPTTDGSVCSQPNAGFRIKPFSFYKKGVYDLNIYVMGKNGMETKVTIAGLRIDKP